MCGGGGIELERAYERHKCLKSIHRAFFKRKSVGRSVDTLSWFEQQMGRLSGGRGGMVELCMPICLLSAGLAPACLLTSYC